MAGLKEKEEPFLIAGDVAECYFMYDAKNYLQLIYYLTKANENTELG